MKKLLVLFSVIFALSVLSHAQGTQLDFSMQYQNTNQHTAVIYPNPINQPVFNIKSNSFITKISVVNMVGKNVYNKKYSSNAYSEVTVELPRCNKGVYLVKITFDDNETVIKKLFYQ